MNIPIEIKELFNDLKDIKYAVFKEIDVLEDGLNGKGDIDVFVDRSNENEFRKILQKYKAIERKSLDKDIKFFYLYIPSIDKLVLLHVHFRLLIGSKRFKEIEISVPYNIEFIDNIKIFRKELMLIIAMIRSVFRRELKEDEKLLNFYIKNSDKNVFYTYCDVLNLDFRFPLNPKEILTNEINFKNFIKKYRYFYAGISILDYKIRYLLGLPVVRFKKGIYLNVRPYSIEVFKRLELKKRFIYKFFGAIVIGNKSVTNEEFWNLVFKELY